MTALTSEFSDQIDLIQVGVVALATAAIALVAIRVGFGALKGMFRAGH